MPSIFEQPTDINRASQEVQTSKVSARVKERLIRISQQLVAKRNLVSSTLLLLLLVWLWMSDDAIMHVNAPVQQALTLPNVNNATTATASKLTSSTDKQSATSSPLVTTLTETPKQQPSAHKPPNQLSELDSANQKAIKLALAGQASQATNTLEQALLSDPQAGLVFENLRRLYAGFASQSYQLALEPSKPKPITVELASADKKILIALDAPKTTSEATKSASTPPVTNKPITAAPNNTEAVTEPVAASSTQTIEPAPVPVVKVNTTVVSEPTPAQKEAAQRKANLQALQQALKHWSDAWSKQDVKGYFSSYAPTYSPKSTTRKAWMDYRQERILAPKRIKVELSDVKIVLLKANLAKVSFSQSYTSDTLSARDQKTLELELINNAWLITSESGR